MCSLVGQASESSPNLVSALYRIDDAKAASQCRDRMFAPGFATGSLEHAKYSGTSRTAHKRRDISKLCIDFACLPQVPAKRRKTLNPYDTSLPSVGGDVATLKCYNDFPVRHDAKCSASGGAAVDTSLFDTHVALTRGVFDGQDAPT